LPLSDIKIPPYRYFSKHLMNVEGPKHWARIRFLQACERLDIPYKLWPEFARAAVKEPTEYGVEFTTAETFSLPAFHTWSESEDEWRARARAEFERFLEKWELWYRGVLEPQIKNGSLIPIKQTRETTPLDLRYEWAAKRFCYNTPYRELAVAGYNEGRIKKTVAAIFREGDIRKAK
jgi:hypothetical protein